MFRNNIERFLISLFDDVRIGFSSHDLPRPADYYADPRENSAERIEE